MTNQQIRKVAESIEKGDKIRIGHLDADLTVTQDPLKDPNHGALSVFAEKKHYPKEGLFTKVDFAIDSPSGTGANVIIRVYDGENYTGDKVDEEKYDAVEQLSIVE